MELADERNWIIKIKAGVDSESFDANEVTAFKRSRSFKLKCTRGKVTKQEFLKRFRKPSFYFHSPLPVISKLISIHLPN